MIRWADYQGPELVLSHRDEGGRAGYGLGILRQGCEGYRRSAGHLGPDRGERDRQPGMDRVRPALQVVVPAKFAGGPPGRPRSSRSCCTAGAALELLRDPGGLEDPRAGLRYRRGRADRRVRGEPRVRPWSRGSPGSPPVAPMRPRTPTGRPCGGFHQPGVEQYLCGLPDRIRTSRSEARPATAPPARGRPSAPPGRPCQVRRRTMNDGPQRVPRWNLALNDGIEALVRLVHVSVLLLLLALLGLLLLGAGPAACAAVPVLQAAPGRTARCASPPPCGRSFGGRSSPPTVRVTPLLLGAIAALGTVLSAHAGAVPHQGRRLPSGRRGGHRMRLARVSVAVMTTVPLVRRQDPLVALRLALLAPGTRTERGADPGSDGGSDCWRSCCRRWACSCCPPWPCVSGSA